MVTAPRSTSFAFRCLAFAGCAALPCTPGVAQDGDGPRWWKGNLHTHSLWSDGNDFPETIAGWYRDRGWHFLALSDHNVLSVGERWMKVDDVIRRGGRAALARYRERFGAEWVETRDGAEGKLEVRLRPLDEFRGLLERPGEFLMVQAEEITDGVGGRPVHINASNLVDKIEPQHGTSVRRVMDRNLVEVRAQAEALGRPIVPHLNHPNFGWGITAEDLATVLEERFFEVYNGHPGVRQEGDGNHPPVERLWDIANTLRIDRYGAPPLFGLATDDSHHYFTEGMGRSNSGRGWVWVRARRLDPDALMTALLVGDFYASSGVTLRDVRLDRDADQQVLTVEIEPEDGVEYETRFVGTREGFDRSAEPPLGEDGATLQGVTWRYSDDVGADLARVAGTSASYTLRGDELYVRAVVTSTAVPANPSFEGQRQQAWTQPVGWRGRVGAQASTFGAVRCDGVWSGPLRGLAVDPRGSIYWLYPDALVRTNAAGQVLARAPLAQAMAAADVCARGGEVLVLLHPEPGRPAVAKFDGATLQPGPVHPLGDIAGQGRALTWVGAAHLVAVGTADGELHLHTVDRDFAPQRSAVVADAGDTCSGMTFADGRLWLGGGEDDGVLFELDVTGAVLRASDLDCGAGLATLPAGRFLVGRSDRTETPAGVQWRGEALVAVPGPKGGLVLVQ